MELTKSDLAELKALCEAATPGPWKDQKQDIYKKEEDNGLIIDLDDDYIYMSQAKNAAFIARSREALPALLADLEEAEAEKAKFEKMVDFLVGELEERGSRTLRTREEGRKFWRDRAEKAANMTWEEWKAELVRLAGDRYGPKGVIEETGEDGWLESFEMGLSPQEALEEDLRNE
jgi:hypothetical protein